MDDYYILTRTHRKTDDAEVPPAIDIARDRILLLQRRLFPHHSVIVQKRVLVHAGV